MTKAISPDTTATAPKTCLVLDLRPGELLLINGASIRFRTRARIELTTHARFLFGRQIMLAEDADTPAQRIYLALQSVYIGTEEQGRAGLATARWLVRAFRASAAPAWACELVTRAMAAAETGGCYEALKLVRRVIRHEEAGSGRDLVEGEAA